MKLKKARCYNPFFVDMGAKCYELNNIHFFDKSGVICSTGHGWFSTTNNEFKCGLELDIDCVIKRKVDFDIDCAFILPSRDNDSISWYTNKKLYELYIPAAAVGLKLSKAQKSYNNHCFIVSWLSNINGVIVDKWHFIDENLSKIEDQINAIGKEINTLYQDRFSKLPELLKELSKLEKARKIELEKMDKITSEEILQQYERSEGNVVSQSKEIL